MAKNHNAQMWCFSACLMPEQQIKHPILSTLSYSVNMHTVTCVIHGFVISHRSKKKESAVLNSKVSGYSFIHWKGTECETAFLCVRLIHLVLCH